MSCFESLAWSLDNEKIKDINTWYELWSKAGASPNYVVENKLQYIKGLNWFPNWIDNYFFNKVSDFLLSVSLVLIIFWFVFISKQKKKNRFNKLNYLVFFIYFTFCLIEWFLKHPSLRYGGYHLIPILTFIPLSIYFNKCEMSFIEFSKKSFIFFILIAFIFISRNINRLHNEYEFYNYNLIKNYRFIYDVKFYNRYLNIIKKKDQEYLNFFGKKFTVIKPLD